MKRAIVVLTAVVSLAIAPATRADGLPVLGIQGGGGVASSDGAHRFVSFIDGRRTIVAKLDAHDATVKRYGTIKGRFSVPIVAYDGSGSGLSADGSTLVLIRDRTRIPQKQTKMVVLDAKRLKVLRHITLQGDFSFDAVAPDGSTMYLVNYLSLSRRSFDPTVYKVRAFDLAAGKLLRAPVVDPNNPGEKMGGLPVTRTMSADGRWAYTLYAGGAHPFVHAIDTNARTARCIDLDALTAREDLFSLKLRLDAGGSRLNVVSRTKPLLAIDTTSFAVTKPAPVRAPGAHGPAATGDGPAAWLIAALVGAAVLAAAGLLAVTRGPLARGARAR
jgi:hypothetical protein